MEEKNNLSQEIDKIIVISTSFPNQVFILSVLEPILKYYSTEGYIIKIKNSKDEEISIGELVNNILVILKTISNKKRSRTRTRRNERNRMQSKRRTTDKQERDEKYRKEQEEIKKWG